MNCVELRERKAIPSPVRLLRDLPPGRLSVPAPHPIAVMIAGRRLHSNLGPVWASRPRCWGLTTSGSSVAAAILHRAGPVDARDRLIQWFTKEISSLPLRQRWSRRLDVLAIRDPWEV